MKKPDPSDYRAVKRAAGELADAMNFELLQSIQSKPQVRTTTGRLKTFPTWLAAYSWLLAVWRDRQPKVQQAKPPPMAIFVDEDFSLRT